MNHSVPIDDVISRHGVQTAPSLDELLTRLRGCPREALVDELHGDQAYRWASGHEVPVEDYLRGWPELAGCEEDALVLICGEIQLRRKAGQEVNLEAYQQRFPHFAQQLGLQFQINSLLASSPADYGAKIICPSCQDSIELPENGLPDKVVCPTCGSSIQLESQPTARCSPAEIQRTLGHYELIEVVGAGSFGTVYKARDAELDRVVAIKIPRAGQVTSASDIERFLREARSAAQLRHPSIVSIYEVGQADTVPFLVAEFVDGVSLADLLSAKRPSPRESAELIAVVADALQYAHDMGVVHRDIKPANIMLDKEGKPRLMDFGLAKRETGDVTMTVDGQILGTPAYMSPEQAKGESHRVDGRTDVYSLGVILYQLLTGELPFRGTTRMLLHQVLHDEPRRPRGLADHVPRDLETICLRAMGKEPSGRYATARDMAEDLRRFLRDEPIQARPIGGAERVWRWCRRKPALASLTAVVGTLLVAIAAGGTAVVSVLLIAIAAGGTIAAAQFRRQAQKEKSLRSEGDENLYYHRIALTHRDLTASLPNPGRAESLLDACPLKRRDWEWHYLKRLWRTEPVVLRDPGGEEFNSVSFSPGGTQLAAACGDGTVRVWNLKTNEAGVLRGHVGYVFSVAFNPRDNSRLASTGADATVRVWDLSTGREVLQLPGRNDAPANGKGSVYSVTFSPDGKWLAACSGERTVRIWDATTGRLIHELPDHDIRVSCVAFSRDGQLLATGDWLGNIRIWDARTGRFLRKLEHDETHPVGGLAFNPGADSQQVAAGFYSGRVAVWNVPSGKPDQTLGPMGIVNGLAFHPNGQRLAAASEDRTVMIWNPHTGREILELRGHTDFCRGLAISPVDPEDKSDGGWLSASTGIDRTIRLWDATPLSGNDSQEARTFADQNDEVGSVAISPDGTQLAAAGKDPVLRIWDSRTGKLSRAVSDFTTIVFHLVFSPDGRYLAAAGIDKGDPPFVVKVFDVQNREIVAMHREPHEIFATAFHPGGQWLALGFMDGGVKLASLTDSDTNRIVPLGEHESDLVMRGLTFRHDGQRLASASRDGMVKVWDLRPILSVQKQNGESAVAPRSKEAGSFHPLREFGHRGIALWSVAYSPDGRQIITGSIDGQLTLWDAESGDELQKKSEASSGGFLSAVYSPDGRWIVSASEDCTARVYDATTLELVHRFRGHLGPIHCLAVSYEFLVTGSADKTVKVWSLKPLEREFKASDQ